MPGVKGLGTSGRAAAARLKVARVFYRLAKKEVAMVARVVSH